ncbi:MAG: aspartate aminotransferase [Spirochaetes bacterium RIFOXYB1_FULL_32_8]|nr:MAG: aspartate aminotransferase [Spirochaetes bacterium RIFOXYB1_FULL_32_8]
MIAKRMTNIPKSFIREILKVASNPDIISFAGGLPNPGLFPVQEIQEASNKVFSSDGTSALQYSTTEGYLALREYISARYKEKENLDISPDEILITNGSQQGLDLLGKVLIDDNDGVIIEKPGYLGAIQAFSMYNPEFYPVSLENDGVDMKELTTIIENNAVKLFYGIPNFQNPSGVTYSTEKREQIAQLLDKRNVLFIEDNPYGELRFMGGTKKSIKSYLPDSVLLGSFSKIVSPSLRLGWIAAPQTILEKCIIAKQASDLHTNYLSQRILYQYLTDNNLDNHISKITATYKMQRDIMVQSINTFFPGNIEYTKPEGGMFLWITLPNGMSAMKLFERAIEKGVAFVPGKPFYVNDNSDTTLRLNFSNVTGENIQKGIEIMSKIIRFD